MLCLARCKMVLLVGNPVIAILHLLFLFSLCLASCPPAEDIGPKCHCYDTDYGGTLSCRDIMNHMELLAPVEATVGHNMLGLTMINSTLRFFPHDLFHQTNYEEIRLMDTQLLSLSDSDIAFEGLEEHLREIRAIAAHYVSQWDFEQLQNHKKLKIIDVNSVIVEYIAQDLPEFPELEIFGLTNAELSVISDNAFAKCPKLKIFALNSNHLQDLKRRMLPNPANYLNVINLQHNQLTMLPDDFFTNMPALTDVYLNHNRFITLEENSFKGIFNSLQSLTMNGNPIVCDCRMFWMMKNRLPTSLSLVCDAPKKHEGKTVRELKVERCPIG